MTRSGVGSSALIRLTGRSSRERYQLRSGRQQARDDIWETAGGILRGRDMGVQCLPHAMWSCQAVVSSSRGLARPWSPQAVVSSSRIVPLADDRSPTEPSVSPTDPRS